MPHFTYKYCYSILLSIVFKLLTLPSQYDTSFTLSCSPINDIQSQFSHTRQFSCSPTTLSGSLTVHMPPSQQINGLPLANDCHPYYLATVIADTYIVCLSTFFLHDPQDRQHNPTKCLHYTQHSIVQ